MFTQCQRPCLPSTPWISYSPLFPIQQQVHSTWFLNWKWISDRAPIVNVSTTDRWQAWRCKRDFYDRTAVLNFTILSPYYYSWWRNTIKRLLNLIEWRLTNVNFLRSILSSIVIIFYCIYKYIIHIYKSLFILSKNCVYLPIFFHNLCQRKKIWSPQLIVFREKVIKYRLSLKIRKIDFVCKPNSYT